MWKPGSTAELEIGQAGAVGHRARRDRHPDDDVVRLAKRDAQDRVQLLPLLDEPHHLLGLVAEVRGGLGQVQGAQRRWVEVVAARSTHSSSRSCMSSRRSSRARTSAARLASPSTSEL